MKRAKSGSTLVELCLVIALSSIVFAMVASFSSLVYFHAKMSVDQQAEYIELNRLHEDIRVWLQKNDDSIYCAGTGKGGKRLLLDADHGNDRSLEFDANFGSLIINDIHDRYRYDLIRGISFEVRSGKDDRTLALIICTVSYTAEGNDTLQEVKFVFSANAITAKGADA